MQVTPEVLTDYCGVSAQVAEKIAELLEAAAITYEIAQTPARLAAFLANCSVESGGFANTVENLNYSAQGLANTWPHRFAANPAGHPLTPNELALGIAHNQKEIANHVYADRMGNGDYYSNDGWKYRGHGYIQTTGKEAHTRVQEGTGIDCVNNPDILSQPEEAAEAAAYEFVALGCVDAIDAGDFDKTVALINGRGMCEANNGPLRLARYQELLKQFSNSAPAIVPVEPKTPEEAPRAAEEDSEPDEHDEVH